MMGLRGRERERERAQDWQTLFFGTGLCDIKNWPRRGNCVSRRSLDSVDHTNISGRAKSLHPSLKKPISCQTTFNVEENVMFAVSTIPNKNSCAFLLFRDAKDNGERALLCWN